MLTAEHFPSRYRHLPSKLARSLALRILRLCLVELMNMEEAFKASPGMCSDDDDDSMLQNL